MALTDALEKDEKPQIRQQSSLNSQLKSSSSLYTGNEILGSSEDGFLNRLTERLALRIRDEVKSEMSGAIGDRTIRDKVTERMEGFLEDELQAYNCKICYELMAGPERSPILLFPCGHTFCQACLNQHQQRTSSKGTGSCPFCRARIENQSVNLSLRDLISTFARQKARVESGRARSLDEVFGSSSGPSGSSDSGGGAYASYTSSSSFSSSSSSSSSQQPIGTSEALRSIEMRLQILQSEAAEYTHAQAELEARRRASDAALAHFEAERVRVEREITLLQEELVLVQKHTQEQRSKCGRLDVEAQELAHRQQLLTSSVADLEALRERTVCLEDAARYMK